MRESRNNIALRVCKIAVITHTEPLKIRIAHCKNAGLYYCERIKNRHFTVAVRVAAFPWGGADYIYYTTEYRDLFLQGPEATPIGVVLGPSIIHLRHSHSVEAKELLANWLSWTSHWLKIEHHHYSGAMSTAQNFQLEDSMELAVNHKGIVGKLTAAQ